MKLTDLPDDNEPREVRLSGRLAAYFGRPTDPLLLIGRALTSRLCYVHFGESFAHLTADGVMRHGTVIGPLDDIEILGVVHEA